MKSRILSELKKNNSMYVSGEALSEYIGVSRTAVWKCIKQLKNEGYVIQSSPNKGYRLISVPDTLSADEIKYKLNTRFIGKDIYNFDVIDSTNIYAKKLATEGCSDGTIIISETQTAGRGRMGREWNSAGGLGIWMSVVLKPKILPEAVQLITLAASVAIVKAISATIGIQCGIKWPNDIILESRKLCGILTEMSCEADQINYVVVGMGLNVNQTAEDFGGELNDKAISLKMHDADNLTYNRADLVKSILYELERVYIDLNDMQTESIINEWRRFSVTLGKEVCIISKDTKFIGIADDITKEGKLIVRCNDGSATEIVSGEISVRGIMGYIGGVK